MTSTKAASPGMMIIDREVIDHLPAFYKAITEVLIERGRWKLADSENSDIAGAPDTHTCRDNMRGRPNVNIILDEGY